MSQLEQIRSDVTTAMKAGEKERVTALRMVVSVLQQAEKEGSADEQAILRRERKRRRESEAAYREAGRDDLAKQEAFEAGLIETYLPAELSESELTTLIDNAIRETGAEGPRDLGKVMKRVIETSGGRADGKLVSTKVKEALA